MKSRLSTKVVTLAIGTLCAFGCASSGDEPGTDVSPSDGDGTSGDGSSSGDGSDSDGTSGGDGDNGGTPSDGSGGEDGTPGGVDCSGDAPAEPEDLITDFNDGTVGVNNTGGWVGGFYIFNDMANEGNQVEGTGVELMDRCGDPSLVDYSYCTSGSGYATWGAGFGTDLGALDPETMVKSTVDLSAYRGVSFWLLGNAGNAAATAKVIIPDVNTAEEGGSCTTSGTAPKDEQCDPFIKNIPVKPGWNKVEVNFADLQQGGWGKSVPAFSKDKAFGVQIQFGPGATFDVCLDQLVLVR